MWRTNSFSAFLYPTGFVLLSLATASVVAAVVNPTSRLGAILGWRPLQWIGVRSYGIYLWQWPIIVLANPTQTGFHLGSAVLEVGLTLVIASLSWHYVEEPIRHGALGRLWRRLRTGPPLVSRRRLTWALSGGTVAALVLVAVSLAGALPVASSGATAPERACKRRSPRSQGAVDRRDLRGPAERRYRRATAHRRRLPRVLDPRPRHQRRRQRSRRVRGRVLGPDRQDDVGHRPPAGDVG